MLKNCLEECLVFDKYSVNVSFHDHHIILIRLETILLMETSSVATTRQEPMQDRSYASISERKEQRPAGHPSEETYIIQIA